VSPTSVADVLSITLQVRIIVHAMRTHLQSHPVGKEKMFGPARVTFRHFLLAAHTSRQLEQRWAPPSVYQSKHARYIALTVVA
jgi:hypothetical protein